MAKEPNIIDDINTELKIILSDKISFDKIILFGSYANGTFREDSDIDYIIVSKMFRDKDIFEIAELTGGLEYNLTKKFLKPFDLLYYSDLEWETSNSVPINEAKKYGIVLYPPS